jgi:hypothetical protein
MLRADSRDKEPRMRRIVTSLALTLVAAVSHLPSTAAAQGVPAIAGRWDLVVKSDTLSYPSWLEVEPSGSRMLVGRFVGRWGSARPISRVDFDGAKVSFSVPPQWEEGTKDIYFEGRLEGGALAGWTTDASGAKLAWTATRAPALAPPAAVRWGAPVTLFDGKGLAGWVPRGNGTSRWVTRDGVLVNEQSGSDLMTAAKYGDFKLRLEFRCPAGGNSGVYLRGRYEVQINDGDNRGVAKNGLGGVYGFLAPSVPPASRPGQWQSLEVALVGRLVTVAVDGRTVICEQEIPGITGGALDSDEGAPGPILLQGDHTAVEFRNVVLTPAAP